ncbi:hypothetical protein [Lacinutrix jangbogonensis]|uniref:hypothetical protein n=1 Tax=Lacinutrix jangbogonensis TaxID=1469557 RepID=UPI000A5E53E9|nr:hypothetical protein [Lacinutrix jangbogonensis]
MINAVEKGELKKAVYENTLIGDNMDFAVIDCKIYQSKFLKQSSIDNFFKEKVIFQNFKENDFNFYVPFSKFTFKTTSDADNMISSYDYLCDYRNCENEN